MFRSRGSHIFIILAVIIIITIFLLWMFSDIVIYIFVSLVLSAILRPITNYIDNIEIFGLKTPRSIAVIISFVILIIFLAFILLLFVPLISAQIQAAQKLLDIANFSNIEQFVDQVEDYARNHLNPDMKQGYLMEELENIIDKFIENIRPTAILNYLISFTGTIFIYLLAITFITFFLLYEKGLIRKNLLSVVPNPYFELVITAIYKIEKLLSNYLLGLVIQISILFTIISLGLSIVGVKYAFAIAAFAAIINLIPYLGPALGFIFALLVLVSTQSLDMNSQQFVFLVLTTLPVFAIAQLVDNLFLQPIIFSRSVKAHPLEIFIIIFVGATLAGGLGMIAAIPAYTIVRVSFVEFRNGYREYHVFHKDKRYH